MGSKTRLLLLWSFGGLIFLTAITGAAALMVLSKVRVEESQLRNRFLERSEWLGRIRNGIYLSGTLVRDYFAEPNVPEAQALLSKLSTTEKEGRDALNSYAASTPATDQDALALRGEVIAYWKVLNLMEEMAQKRNSAGVDAYFRRQLAQRRETMLSITSRIDKALSLAWRERQAEAEALYGRFRFILSIELLFVIIFGLVVSFAALRRLDGLERETRALSAQLLQAQEQERRAIARDLHDEVGQALASLLLDVAKPDAIPPSTGLRARLENIIDEVRRIALSLRPSMLDDLGLVAALEWQAREAGGRNGLHVDVQADESADNLPEAHCTCIYRVVQEALRNCARHAEAKRVRVGVRRDSKAVSLQIEDDGRGFNVSRTRGLGLLGMEERVAQLGGTFRVQSRPGLGTIISGEIPV